MLDANSGIARRAVVAGGPCAGETATVLVANGRAIVVAGRLKRLTGPVSACSFVRVAVLLFGALRVKNGRKPVLCAGP